MVEPDLLAALRSYLLHGERLLWAGRPKRGIVFQPGDVHLVPFSLVWAGGVAAIGFGDQSFRDGPIELAFSLVFLVGAIHFTIGRFAVDAWARNQLVYAVTDRRVIILRRGAMPKLRSIELLHLPTLALDERSGGRGTIDFDTPPPHDFGEGTAWLDWSPAASASARFLDIEQARTVYDLIARQSARLIG